MRELPNLETVKSTISRHLDHVISALVQIKQHEANEAKGALIRQSATLRSKNDWFKHELESLREYVQDIGVPIGSAQIVMNGLVTRYCHDKASILQANPHAVVDNTKLVEKLAELVVFCHEKPRNGDDFRAWTIGAHQYLDIQAAEPGRPII